MFYMKNDVLTSELCSELIKAEGQEWESAAFENSDIRTSDVYWKWGGEAVERISQAANEAASKFGLDVDTNAEALQISRYKAGQQYDWHRDSYWYNSKPCSARCLTMALALDDNGIIEVNNIGQVSIPLGTAVFFPSTTFHRAPPTKTNRYTAVTWFPWKKGSPGGMFAGLGWCDLGDLVSVAECNRISENKSLANGLLERLHPVVETKLGTKLIPKTFNLTQYEKGDRLKKKIDLHNHEVTVLIMIGSTWEEDEWITHLIFSDGGYGTLPVQTAGRGYALRGRQGEVTRWRCICQKEWQLELELFYQMEVV